MSNLTEWYQPITNPDLVNRVIAEAKKLQRDIDGDVIKYCGNMYYVHIGSNIVKCILHYEE